MEHGDSRNKKVRSRFTGCQSAANPGSGTDIWVGGLSYSHQKAPNGLESLLGEENVGRTVCQWVAGQVAGDKKTRVNAIRGSRRCQAIIGPNTVSAILSVGALRSEVVDANSFQVKYKSGLAADSGLRRPPLTHCTGPQ